MIHCSADLSFSVFVCSDNKCVRVCLRACVFMQVRQLQEDAVRLQSAYAGDKADDIQKREGEVSKGRGWR